MPQQKGLVERAKINFGKATSIGAAPNTGILDKTRNWYGANVPEEVKQGIDRLMLMSKILGLDNPASAVGAASPIIGGARANILGPGGELAVDVTGEWAKRVGARLKMLDQESSWAKAAEKIRPRVTVTPAERKAVSSFTMKE